MQIGRQGAGLPFWWRMECVNVAYAVKGILEEILINREEKQEPPSEKEGGSDY